MSVRQAQPTDAGAIAVIWNQIIRDTLVTFTTEEKTEAELSAQIKAVPQRWAVAEAKGQTIGFARYFQFRGGPGYAHSMEWTILLAPEARGLGFGPKLLHVLEEAARAEGIHSLYGGVSGANPDGAAFHEAMGFERLAILPEVGRKAGQWLDLHLYQKFL